MCGMNKTVEFNYYNIVKMIQGYFYGRSQNQEQKQVTKIRELQFIILHTLFIPRLVCTDSTILFIDKFHKQSITCDSIGYSIPAYNYSHIPKYVCLDIFCSIDRTAVFFIIRTDSLGRDPDAYDVPHPFRGAYTSREEAGAAPDQD